MTDPEHVRGFLPPLNKKKAWEVVIGIFVMALSLFATWSLGVYSVIGFHGYAWSSDTQRRIDAVQSEVKGEISEIKTQTAQINESLNAVLSDYYLKRLNVDVRDRCKTPMDDPNRQRAVDRVWETYKLYRKYTPINEQIPIPGCGDV